MTTHLSPVIVMARGRDGQAPVMLSATGARRLTEEIRTHLTSAIAKLAQAREGGADSALGYDTWHEYVEAEFGDLRELRLPAVERKHLAISMAGSGMSTREIGARMGVGKSTVDRDIADVDRPAEVIGLDGRRRAARADRADSDPAPAAGSWTELPKTDQVVILVGRQGDRGLTCQELELETGWNHGMASGPLSRCKRQGRVRRTGRFRQGYEVYVVDEG